MTASATNDFRQGTGTRPTRGNTLPSRPNPGLFPSPAPNVNYLGVPHPDQSKIGPARHPLAACAEERVGSSDRGTIDSPYSGVSGYARRTDPQYAAGEYTRSSYPDQSPSTSDARQFVARSRHTISVPPPQGSGRSTVRQRSGTLASLLRLFNE